MPPPLPLQAQRRSSLHWFVGWLNSRQMFTIVEIPTLLIDFCNELVICWYFNYEKLATQKTQMTLIGKQYGQQKNKDHYWRSMKLFWCTLILLWGCPRQQTNKPTKRQYIIWTTLKKILVTLQPKLPLWHGCAAWAKAIRQTIRPTKQQRPWRLMRSFWHTDMLTMQIESCFCVKAS